MGKIYNFFKQLLSSDKDSSSIKRFGILICLLVMIISYFIAQFTSKIPPEFMFNAFSFIVISGMGFTALEKFTKPTVPLDASTNTTTPQ